MALLSVILSLTILILPHTSCCAPCRSQSVYGQFGHLTEAELPRAGKPLCISWQGPVLCKITFGHHSSYNMSALRLVGLFLNLGQFSCFLTSGLDVKYAVWIRNILIRASHVLWICDLEGNCVLTSLVPSLKHSVRQTQRNSGHWFVLACF